MSYQAFKEECDKAGYVLKDDELETCGVSGLLCSGHSCVSKKYWAKAHKQPGWHRTRALERAGLVESYQEEINEG